MDIIFQKDTETPKESFKDKLVKFFKNYDSNFYFFLVLCGLGLLFFISSLWENQFTTLFGGDYTAQQLSFYTNGYDDWWHFFKTGQFRFFDTNTYLGVDNIGANSFYYLFDPFFLPILLCPREFIAQGMVFLTIFKIATAAMFFMQYMKVMGASKNASRLSAMAYAFSGWMAWFLWFNHMTEIMIVFPIMLWGVERILRDKKPWLMMFSLLLMGLTNYFFLIGMTIAAFIYAIFRFFQRLKLNSAKDNWTILGIGFIGFLAGLLLSCVVVLPAALYSLDAPRAANSGYLDTLKEALKNKNFGKFIGMIFSWKVSDNAEFKHFYPLINFAFPAATCRGTPLTIYGDEWYDNVATNIYTYVPMMLLFIPAFIRAMKEKKWSAIVAVVLFVVALETPFAYYMFFGFTAPYGRWELFFITSFITFSGLHYDHMQDDPVWEDIASYVFVMIVVIAGGILAQALIDNYKDFTQRSPYINATGATFVMAGYVTIVFILILFTKKRKSFNDIMTICVGIEAVVMGFLTIQGHWCGSFYDANNGLVYNKEIYRLNKLIEKTDKSYYRVWTYNQNEGARNDGMRNDYNGLGCFHSLYNFNINNFVNWTKIQDGDPFYGGGSWAGSYVWKNADIDKFLGVKYYFMQRNSVQWGWMSDGNAYNDATNPFQYNVPLNYELRPQYQVAVMDDSQPAGSKGPYRNFDVFEDTKHIDFAFGFDNIISFKTREDSVQSDGISMPTSSTTAVLRNDELLLEGMIVDEETSSELASKYSSLSVEKSENLRELKKHKLINVKSELFDLNENTNGQKYTVNTFFEQSAQAWYGKHALKSNELINVDNMGFTKVNYQDNTNVDEGRYVNVVTPNVGTAFDDLYDPNGYAVYVPYYYSDDYGADIYLISEDNTIITWDRHQDDKYGCGWTKLRGFYVHKRTINNSDGTTTVLDAPKLSKIIVANRRKLAISNMELRNGIYYETATEYNNRLSSLEDYKVTDVKYSTNTFKFKTNFTKNVGIVTQLPFEKGWKVTAKTSDGKTKNIKVFSAQGGFASFISEVGDTSYTFSFMPENLGKGILLSLGGAVIAGGSILGYIYLNKRLKKKELEMASE